MNAAANLGESVVGQQFRGCRLCALRLDVSNRSVRFSLSCGRQLTLKQATSCAGLSMREGVREVYNDGRVRAALATLYYAVAACTVRVTGSRAVGL